MKNHAPLVLVDGSSYLYRAYHALPPLTNSKGQPTGAVYGVVNMLRKLIADYTPDYLAVVFDPKGKTTRHKIFADYKATRPPMPEELRTQIQPLHEIIKAMGIPLVMVDGVEADDVIGTLAKEAERAGMPTVISTGDKDMAQLVNQNITCVNTMTESVLDVAGVEKKFGITPDKIIDYLSLIGDKVDNIPGVEKVGPKTAVKWLTEYGSLQGVLENADNIKGKVGENLRVVKDKLPLSKELVTIITNLELPVHPTELKPTDADQEKLTHWFTELEFKKLLAEVLVENKPAIEHHYETVLKQTQWDAWLEKLKAAEQFAFDTETTSLNYMKAEVVGISLAVTENEACYLPLTHHYQGAPEQLNREAVLAALQPLLNDPRKTIIGQNLKYDLNVLGNHDVTVHANIMDTMLESYVLNSGGARHDMDSLALKYLGRNTIHYEDVAGKGAKQITFDQVEIEKASEYAAEDADVTLQLHHALAPKINEVDGAQKVLEEIELPLVPILSKIERTGVLIDAAALSQQSKELAEKIKALEEKAYKTAGKEFNLGSTKQLKEILFDELGLPILKKTPKGAPSTAEEVMQELAIDYPLPEIILSYRSLSKLKSTYTDSLPKQIHEKTGRVHTSYNQAVTATGRLSSTDPNLQNIPVRTEEGRRIRDAFIAPKGYKMIAADYSQIELRIMAHLTQDAGLLKAFEQGLDIHRATASEVFAVEFSNVTPDQRRSAKAINFGIIYGMSAYGLARQLRIQRQVAQEYIDIYFQRYPGIKDYMEQTRKLAHQKGYVETLFGRRLYLPDIHASNKMRVRAAERAAINAPMQGTAADIIKLAMIKIDHWLSHASVDAKMIMQVHDELVFEVAEKDVDTVIEHVCQLMGEPGKLSVALEVGVGVGDNWGEAH